MWINYSNHCFDFQEVHESESGPQNSLFLVTLHHAQLSILSDPSVEGVTRGSEQIKKMDPERFKHFTITISVVVYLIFVWLLVLSRITCSLILC